MNLKALATEAVYGANYQKSDQRFLGKTYLLKKIRQISDKIRYFERGFPQGKLKGRGKSINLGDVFLIPFSLFLS